MSSHYQVVRLILCFTVCVLGVFMLSRERTALFSISFRRIASGNKTALIARTMALFMAKAFVPYSASLPASIPADRGPADGRGGPSLAKRHQINRRGQERHREKHRQCS